VKSHNHLFNDLMLKLERRQVIDDVTTDSSISLDFFFFIFEKVMGLF
jgi:hypothetical protein